MRIRLPWTGRIAVSVGVLAVLLSFLPVGQVAAAIGSVPPVLWLASVALFLAGHLVAAFKWHLLLGAGGRIPAGVWLRAHYAGLAANCCLPGVAGGDLVRVALVTRHAGGIERIAVASVADRLLDCVALLVVASAGALFAGGAASVRDSVVPAAGGVLLVVCLAAAGTLVIIRMRPAGGSVLQRLAVAAGLLAQRPWLPVASLALSIAVQTTFVLINVRLGAAAGVAVPTAAWFVAWPIAKLVAIVPISVAGLGVREAALVVLLAPFGAAPAAVTAAGLVWQSVLWAGGAVGWLSGISPGTARRTPEPTRAVEL